MSSTTDPFSDLMEGLRLHLHKDNDHFAAGAFLAKTLGTHRPNNRQEALQLLNEFLHTLLASERFEDAAALLWQDGIFDSEPECVQSIWNAMPKEALLALQGASSMGKSYTPCVWLMLDWLRDPEWTSIICVGPKEDHLRNNVFSTLTRLHASSSIPLPGTVGDKFIGISRTDSFGGFKGLVIPRAQRGVVLQGMTKAQKRTSEPHPLFGTQGRVRVFVDEVEDCPPLIHQDLANVMSGIDKSDPDRLKIIVAYNPKYANGPVAAMTEPPQGWDAFDLDADFDWRSKRGWRVIRLDAHRSENIIHGRNIYGGLQTQDALDALRSQAGGEDTNLYMTFGRGAFPRTSHSTAAVPQQWLQPSVGSVVWTTEPVSFVGGDLSLGGDANVLCFVKAGYISERRWTGWKDDPSGTQRRLRFNRPRPCILLEKVLLVPGKETMEIARAMKGLLQAGRILGENTNLDPGGPGAGIPHVLKEIWDSNLQVTWAGSSATDTRIMEEDTNTAADTLRIAADEMWLALRRYFEHGFIVVSEDLPVEHRNRLFTELSTRLWKDQTLTKLEKKLDYKRRMGGRSPDTADAFGLAVGIVRKNLSFRPSCKDGAREAKGAAALTQAAPPSLREGAMYFGDPETLLEEMLYGAPGSSMLGGTDPTNRLDAL